MKRTIAILFLIATGQASSSEGACLEPANNTLFDQISRSAVTLSCNTDGYWEARYEDLLAFIYVPRGELAMGSLDGLSNERPVHSVDLDGYWIAKYPVTVGQFRHFVEATGYLTDAERGWGAWQWTGQRTDQPSADYDAWTLLMDGRWNNIYFEQGDDHPVGSVSWNDANAYAGWLSEKLGVPFVLPTEAQWEKAARGATQRRFPWGDDAPDGRLANYADRNFADKYGLHARRPDIAIDDGYVETSPVDAYSAGRSEYGVFDLAGNLGEWVYDLFAADYYQTSPRRNPTGPEVPDGVPDQRLDRVNRGGSWVDWGGVAADGSVEPEGGHSIRAAARTGDEQNSADDHMGFRLAVDGLRQPEAKPADPYMPDLTGTRIITQRAAGDVYMLEATGDVAGNIAALIGTDGILIVDDQFAELTPDIEAALGELTDGKLRFILNTHHHEDHSDGNARLSADSDALIIAHDKARRRMLDRGPGNWPVVTFASTVTLHFNNETVHFLSMPGGHTDNDAVVFFEKANVVHLGDLMNSGTSSFPTADIDAGGNAIQILENVAALLPLIDDDAVIIPGHGPISDKAELHVLRQMLESTIELVRGKKQRGISLEQILDEGAPVEYADWGYGYMPAEGWLEMIYQSLE
ncbi:MAG: SUMF1/EgtB/PvdO family nonheme iron enzyme [Gammaproteobacteria bacterium]|nr:SUMF1/EgtB/PvdO family nonheme iron enzyme [Gammaproteobacteria bacterium]